MSLFEWLTKRKKSLSQMTRSELRRQELLLEKDRTQLLNRVTKLATQKQELFDRGAGEKTPEVRRVLAQEFELKTTEQLMLARQLNIRSKEMLTVSRLRMWPRRIFWFRKMATCNFLAAWLTSLTTIPAPFN